MMTKTKKKNRFETDPVELDLNPMIDIVFNLLIFFMCASKFKSEEGMVKAFLPKDQGLVSSAVSADICTIRLKLLWHDAAGRPTDSDQGFVVLKIDDQVYNQPGELEALGAPEASPMWKELHARLLEFKGAYTGANPTGLPIIIDARKQVPTKYVISTLNEIVRAEISDVTFAAPEIPYR